MMCHSQQICKNTVFVCDSEGNPVPIEGCPDPNTSEDEKIKQLKNA